MASTGWDQPRGYDILFNPNWDAMGKGSRLSLVMDCVTHTWESMIGVTVPDSKQIRVLGAINPQIKGCRRVTLFDVVLENPGKILDVHLDEQSAVIAHGLRPAEDVFRCVELCSGIACSSSGLQHAGFRHVCSVEWRAPFVDLHRTSKPGIPVIHGDICNPSCLKEVACKVDPTFHVDDWFLMSAILHRWFTRWFK